MNRSKLLTALTLSAILLFSLSVTAFAATTTRYEAEKANILGGAKATDSPVASGGQYVGDNNIVGTDAVEFTVNVPADGTYQLQIGYGTTDTGAIDTIMVNGTKAADVSFPATNAWLYMSSAVEAIAKQNVTLKAGDNKIRFNPNAKSVNLDYIDVVSPSAAAANPKTGDAGMMPYFLLLAFAAAGLVYFRKEFHFARK